MMELSWIKMWTQAAAALDARPCICTLATIDASDAPAARSVVCRGIDEAGVLQFCCDARSAKVAQLRANPSAAVVAWFAETRQQFRVSGRIVISSLDSTSAERLRIWQSLTPQSRAMFFWPEPGLPRQGHDVFIQTSVGTLPPQTFVLLALHAAEVEYLDLNPHPHRRIRWRAETNWELEDLNP